ncbi:MAG: OmpA family protein [Actinobacteria bacterium]|nr:MAG: OmpA family protein [Actinomycetota bacterium]
MGSTMQPELDELLSGLRHLRRRAARGDLAWIDQRFADGRLRWLQKLFPPGGYDRFGRDLVTGNVASVRRALSNIDDTTVGDRLGYRTVTRRVGAFPVDDEPLLVSIEPDSGYVSQQTTAPHRPLDEFIIDPEPLDTQFAFGAVDDPYFTDDYAFNDRFEAALGTGYDAAGGYTSAPGYDGVSAYDSGTGYDGNGDRIVIVDDAVAGAGARTRRPTTRGGGFPPADPFGDEPRRANPLTWLFVLAGLVVVFALVFSQCGSDPPKRSASNPTTTVAQVAQTAGVAAAGTVAASATGTTPVARTSTVAAATSGVRNPTTWVIYFAVNSTTIDSAGQQVVKDVADRLRTSAAGTPVVLTGYSDTTGNPANNLLLAQNRATVVRDAIAAAVPQAGAKFSIESKGDSQPEADAARSRRVTITVS